MSKNFKLRLLTSISAVTLLVVAHAHEVHAQVIDYNKFNKNMSNIYSTMNTMGSWNEVMKTSLQGISGKSIRKLRSMQSEVSTVEQQWQAQNSSLTKLSATERLAVYNSQSYQDAYAQYLYISKYVKPLTAKLISGAHLTVTEAKQYADPFAINAIKNTEKATTVAQFINQQTLSLGVITPPTTVTPTPVTPPTTVTPTPVTSTVTNLSPIITTNTNNGAEFIESNVSFSDSASTSVVTTGTPTITKSSQDVVTDVPNNNGTITRTTKRITTTTTTTPKTTVSTVQRTFVDKVYKTSTTVTVTTPRTKTTYSDGREITTEGTPVTVTSAPVKTFIRDITRTETIETGRNTEHIVSNINDAPGTVVSVVSVQKTISNTQSLAPIIVTSNSEGAQYVNTSYVDGEPISIVTNGPPTVSTTTSNNIVDTKNTDGSISRKTYNITTTTTITPKTTNVTKIRTYTDAIKKDITVTTNTTPVTRNNYSDGTYIDINGSPVITSSKETKLISNNTRTETITVSDSTDNITTTSSNAPGVLVSTVAIAAPVIPSNDPNMGTPTAGVNSDPNFYKTNEFIKNNANSQINADKAYARGWTGKGVTVAVADTGYAASHQDLQGQVIATKDYTGKGMNDVHGHGTHVLGTIVALKNDQGTHGVAYDSKAIVIRIGGDVNMVRGKPVPSASVNTDDGARGLAWAADNGATVGNLSANSTYDRTFTTNELVSKGNGNYVVQGRYNYGIGQYYNMQDPNLWKTVTDKGMVVVNSAGNQGLPVAANPGYFATVTDQSGNLLLGGKMLIVGAVDKNNLITGYSNRAGHICQKFNHSTNACADKYRVSDFYILAPGGTISTNKDGGEGYMQGTSMAAPVVTGGVAIVSQMWPYMKGENIVKLLTTTANKNIPEYNKEIHGSGVLDLDRATQPVGAVGIPTGGRSTSAAKVTGLTNTGGSGTALSALAKSGTLSNVMIVDEFQRDFYINLSQGITVKDKRKVSEVNVQQSGSSYLPFQHSVGSFEQGGEWHITDDLKFGFSNSKNVKGDYTTHVAKDWKVDDRLQVRTTMGTIGEKHTWLGNDSSGALSVGKNNKTYFSQIGLDYVKEKDTWSIDLGRGLTTVNTSDDSMIKKVNTLQSQSLKLGYERHIDDYEKWGVTVSMPNYISRGSATVQLPYATTADGDIMYENVKTNLKTRTPERNIGLYYTASGENDRDWGIRFSTEFRHNIAGETGKKGVEVGLQFEKKF